jgi:hypothetical protein
MPDLPKRVLSGEKLRATDAEPRSKIKFIDAFIGSSWHNQQYALIASGQQPEPHRGTIETMAIAAARLQRDGLLYGRK